MPITTESQEKLQEIFRAVFELAPDSDVTKVRKLSTSRWDSLAHVSLVVAIESEFGIALDLEDAQRISSYEAAEILLEDKGL
jgi:acyl carrier protein